MDDFTYAMLSVALLILLLIHIFMDD